MPGQKHPGMISGELYFVRYLLSIWHCLYKIERMSYYSCHTQLQATSHQPKNTNSLVLKQPASSINEFDQIIYLHFEVNLVFCSILHHFFLSYFKNSPLILSDTNTPSSVFSCIWRLYSSQLTLT